MFFTATSADNPAQTSFTMSTDHYYTVRPLLPRWLQIVLRRLRVGQLSHRSRGFWPISESTAKPPVAWPGWPEKKRFALILTHDVEQTRGLSRCEDLARLEEQRGVRSAFGFVPYRYAVPEGFRRELRDRGFEIMVHDFNHDGKLYRNRQTFEKRRGPINEVLARWETRGFASGASLHNLAWISELNIDYDISTYDTDPFEPQSCGLGRVLPFWVQPPNGAGHGFVELPYTLPQDFTLFVLMRERSNDIWRRKLDWIAERGGMALIKTHPDYMAFGDHDRRIDRYPVEFYTDFLDYVRERYDGQFWLAHPSEVARYWRGLQPAGAGNTIALRDTFCASCREAHAKGWFSEYQPARLAEQQVGVRSDP